MTEAAFDHSGSALDDSLADEGLLDEAEASAVRRVIAWQNAEAMRAQGMDRDTLAERMGANRPAVDRLLDTDGPDDRAALVRAARALGKRLRIDVVEAA